MTADPLKLIEQYLERVRIYMPLNADEPLMELRTHLIEEAENIGGGIMTAGSAMMAIERLGDPKSVANEYAGTGEKKGPLPKEYYLPVMKLIVAIVGIIITFLIGAYIISFAVPMVFTEIFIINVIMNIVLLGGFIILVIGVILLFEDRSVADKTVLESAFGIAVEGFQPKSRIDALAGFVMSLVFSVALVLPQFTILYSPSFRLLLMPIAFLVWMDSIKGLLFFYAGENTLNLVIEAILGAIWIVLAMSLITIGWPLDFLYIFDGSQWTLISVQWLRSLMDLPFTPFDFIWIFVVFLIVVGSSWQVIAAAVKIPIYVRDGNGLWWQGRWREVGKPWYRRLRIRREPKHYRLSEIGFHVDEQTETDNERE